MCNHRQFGIAMDALNNVTSNSAFVILLAVFSFLFIKYFQLRKKKLPPGPWGLPFVGYTPFLDIRPHKQLFELRKKYGNMIGVRIGRKYLVILNEYEIMKEVYSHPSTLDKEGSQYGAMPLGFGTANGEEWIEQRRFAINAMKNLGLGKKVWENVVSESAKEFTDYIASFNNKPADISDKLHEATIGNIISLLSGRKLDCIKDRKNIDTLIEISHLLRDETGLFKANSFISQLLSPILVILKFFKMDKETTVVSSLYKFIKNEIIQCRTSNENEESFLKLYDDKLKSMKSQDKRNFFNENNYIGNYNVLYLGGSDTVFTAIGWLIQVMAKYQDVQEKVQTELDDVFGKDGIVNFEDRFKVPYTLAVILETQRYGTIGLINITRLANHDFEIRGYTIPKGTMIVSNIWGLHHDPNYWDDPDEFQPERFLTKEGELKKNVPSFTPFSFGKRNCPGETVALIVIFLFFTAILRRFSIKTPNGLDLRLVEMGSLINYLKPQALCFVERQ